MLTFFLWYQRIFTQYYEFNLRHTVNYAQNNEELFFIKKNKLLIHLSDLENFNTTFSKMNERNFFLTSTYDFCRTSTKFRKLEESVYLIIDIRICIQYHCFAFIMTF